MLLAIVGGSACGEGPLALDFTLPTLDSEVALDGITFRATSSIFETSPTRIRTVVIIRNETLEIQDVTISSFDCMVRIRTYWSGQSAGEQLVPGPEVGCFASASSFELDPGEEMELPTQHEFAPSELLGSRFRPSVFAIGAVVERVEGGGSFHEIDAGVVEVRH